MYTISDFHFNPAIVASIKRWNVEGSLQRPKGITLNSKRPLIVVKAVFFLENSYLTEFANNRHKNPVC